MKSGKLRTTVRFFDVSNTPKPDGSPNETLIEVCKVKARVLYLRGKAFFGNYQYLHMVQGRAFIRYRSDLKNHFRIRINGEDFSIESIKPCDEKRRELEIIFKAVEK